MNFVQSTQIKPKNNFMALIYGPTGIGKTTLALSAPSPALIDFDGGITRVDAAFTPNALVAQITAWEGWNAMVTQLSQLPSETLIIDTASKMVEMIQHYVMTSDAYNYAKKGLKKPSVQAWGDIKQEFVGFLRGIKATGKNIVVVAQEVETTVTTPKGDIRYRIPACGSDKQRTEYLQDMDLVGYMYKDGSNTNITFNQTDAYYGKNTCGLAAAYQVPTVEDAEGNNFFQTIRSLYVTHQQENLDRASYYAQVKELTDMVGRIDGAEKANKFTAYAAKVKWQLDAKVKVIDAFNKKVAELGLKKEGKGYV